jgi:Ras-related protein Rab-5C
VTQPVIAPLRHVTAKKIPIEHILAASKGGSNRPGAAGSRAGGSRQDNVNLEENSAKSKDACAC